jgi:hypothetical protein
VALQQSVACVEVDVVDVDLRTDRLRQRSAAPEAIDVCGRKLELELYLTRWGRHGWKFAAGSPPSLSSEPATVDDNDRSSCLCRFRHMGIAPAVSQRRVLDSAENLRVATMEAL